MSEAYRCDGCGQFRDGQSVQVGWYTQEDVARGKGGRVDLCPACAPAVVERLEGIAETQHGDGD